MFSSIVQSVRKSKIKPLRFFNQARVSMRKMSTEIIDMTKVRSFLSNPEHRKEIYLLVGGVSVSFSFLTGCYQYWHNKTTRRLEKRAVVGRKLVKEIEDCKINLKKQKYLIKTLLCSEKFDCPLVKKAIEESNFDYILRYIWSHDTSIVPNKLRIETEYQLHRLRKVMHDFQDDYKKDPDKLKSNILESLDDIYHTINIASVVVIANTIPHRIRSEIEKLVCDSFDNPNITVDEIRTKIYAQKTKELLEDCHAKKIAFWKNFHEEHPEELKSKLIRDLLNFDIKESVRTHSERPKNKQ